MLFLKTRGLWLTASFALTAALGFGASAQTPSDPSVVLPKPPEPFAGKIGRTLAQSTAAWPKPVTAPANAPNVVVIMTDDVGFAASSTFGGPIPTPNLDRLAARGLKYNEFHTTALCSPTRAALLTGRNHQAVATGTVVDVSTGFPGYWSEIPKSAATVAEVLKDNGYNTAFFGKHHNVPDWQASAAGPFDLWPTGLGFEYFYGFIGGDNNQWQPKLYRNTTAVDDHTHDSGQTLDHELADEAINWIHNQRRPLRISPSLSTTRRAVVTRRTKLRLSGSPSLRVNLIKAGTRLGKRLSPAKRPLALFPKMRS